MGVGVAIGLGSGGLGSGIASADPSNCSGSGCGPAPAVSAADITNAVQKQASESRAHQGQAKPAEASETRQAPTGADNQPKPTEVNAQPSLTDAANPARVGDRPRVQTRPLRDAIAKLQKQAQVLNQIATAFSKLSGL